MFNISLISVEKPTDCESPLIRKSRAERIASRPEKSPEILLTQGYYRRSRQDRASSQLKTVRLPKLELKKDL